MVPPSLATLFFRPTHARRKRRTIPLQSPASAPVGAERRSVAALGSHFQCRFRTCIWCRVFNEATRQPRHAALVSLTRSKPIAPKKLNCGMWTVSPVMALKNVIGVTAQVCDIKHQIPSTKSQISSKFQIRNL